MKYESRLMVRPISAIALIAGVGLGVCVASPAMAQNTEEEEAEQQQPVDITDRNATSSNTDGTIIVTGSRIRQSEFDSPSLVQVITRDETTVAGFNSSTEALQGTAVTGGNSQINNAFGGYVTNGGPGANTLSLRGLGTSRSLVLLNGRRLSPAGTRGSVGSADLNTIPSIAVDHYEILKDGASSIYGSDAIAGVVNVITRKRVDGIELDGGVTVPEFGAGVTTRLGAMFGQTGDRWSFMGAIEYLKRTDMTMGDRGFTRCQTQGRLNPPDLTMDSGSVIDPLTGMPKCYPINSTGDSGVTINTIGTAYMLGVPAPGATSDGTWPGLGAYNRWRPNASVTTGFPGFEGVGGAFPGHQTGLHVRDTFESRMLNQSLYSPVQTLTGFFQGSYDTGALGNAEAYVEVLATRRKSYQIGYRQMILDYGTDDDALLPPELQGLPVYVPAGTDLTNGQPLAVRAFIGFGNDRSEQKVDFYRIGGGLKGDFFIPGWRYDFYGGIAHSKGTYSRETFLTDKLQQSLDSAVVGGEVVCSDPSDGCVPAVLTYDLLAGNVPSDLRAFIFRNDTGVTKYTEKTLAFGADGDLFNLPYGTVKAFIGAEMRWQSINDQPSLDSQNGNLYNLTSATITKGKDNVKEVFGELEFPLLKGVTGAENLTLTVSGRYTDYKSYGSDFTWKAGGIWSPFEWFKFRGAYGTSFRAPALFEQFLGATSGFLSSSNDPCDNYGALDPGSFIYQNCAAEGLPTTFQQTSGITVLTLGGAETGLAAETSKNWTIGGVLQPNFSSDFGDLELAVDYYSIKVSNGVARLGGGTILDQCYSDPDGNGGTNGGQFCRLIERDPVDNSLTVTSSYVNISDDQVEGIDYNLRYSREIGTGTFRIQGQMTQVLGNKGRIYPTDPLTEYKGTIGSPKWSGTLEARYSWKQWALNYGFDWIDGMDSTQYLLGDTAEYGDGGYDFKVGDYWTHYMSVQYRGDNFSITAGVRNLFDAKIPTISSGYYNRVGNAPLYSGYDYVGRKFFVNFSSKL
ncbi:MAG: TonB-dependent receptor domain-containing protein [Sphingomonadaceae bacterium]